jgi:uncharacterized protein YkwD
MRISTFFSPAAMQRIFLIPVFFAAIAFFSDAAVAGEQPEIDTVQLERLIHRQINRERQRYGLAALKPDELLTEIARNHSRDMAEKHFFSHVNLQGEDPDDRGKRQGWNRNKQIGPRAWTVGLAENIFLSRLYDRVVTTTQNGVVVNREYDWKTQEQIAQSTVQEWMNSPGHRNNILSPEYDRQGIGVAISGQEVYITEDMF